MTADATPPARTHDATIRTGTVANHDANVDATTDAVLRLLLPLRRTPLGARPGESGGRIEHWPVQRAAIRDHIRTGDPIEFTLPGFPCKSPNPSKVAGTLPDEGERVALRNLDALCTRIGEVYEPGARVIICSDGHVFTDVIGVADETISAYNDELRRMIAAEGFTNIRTIDLRDIWGDADFDVKRRRLDEDWAPSLEEVREEVREGGQSARLLRGMTRFMVADTVGWTGTKTQLQKLSKQRAYELLRRSRAWGDVVADALPRPVRLSIHPQVAGSTKYGIMLVDAHNEVWTTPWHSTLVYDADGNAHLRPHSDLRGTHTPVHRDGRISHYVEKP